MIEERKKRTGEVQYTKQDWVNVWRHGNDVDGGQREGEIIKYP